jgi:nickel-dependent lactate racemase
MKEAIMKFGSDAVGIRLPDQTTVFSMRASEPLSDPAAAIEHALDHSIGSPGLDRLITGKLQENPDLTAVVVISDNTRPVPYRDEQGILWPVVRRLLDHGLSAERILVLVATGTHRALSEAELRTMLDPRIFEHGIPIKNHDCQDESGLAYLGETTRGSRVFINRDYVNAGLKILTGLVESHFMAGVSGGRKSICPGLIGEESTYIFHSARMLASPMACDLTLKENPCHEEALEVAKKAGADYIVNVTLDHRFRVTGVFAGDLEAAHERAVEKVREHVALSFDREYDIVVTHAGFVGINHYQTAKAGVAAIPVLKPGGRLIMAAHNTDSDIVGSSRYRTVLSLFKLIGPERFNQLILSPDWTFIPEQWQIQMWAKLFTKIPMENFTYYSPQFGPADYRLVPGNDGNRLLPEALQYRGTLETIPLFVERAVEKAIAELREQGVKEPSIAYLSDGPYGIPMR